MCAGDVTFSESNVYESNPVSGDSLQIDACDNKFCNCTGGSDGASCVITDVSCDEFGELDVKISCDKEAVMEHGK